MRQAQRSFYPALSLAMFAAGALVACSPVDGEDTARTNTAAQEVTPDAPSDGTTPTDPGTPTEPSTCATTIPSSTKCGDKLAPGDERTCTVKNRKYIVHAGKTMNVCKPVALVIDAHGATETAVQQLGKEKFCAGAGTCWAGLGSGWAAESDTPAGGFIAVFPQGLNNVWNANDANFMMDIVDEMKKVANIDPDKIFMSGISNGGFLSFQTGCPHSDVFKGISPVTGGSTCRTTKKPISVISFDGKPDFAYDGNLAATTAMAKLNNCKSGPKPWKTLDATTTEAVCRTAKQDTKAQIVPCTQVKSAKIKPTTCKIWDQCDGGTRVVFCDVAPNTEHGASQAALDAHILYENDSILNLPSVAWRFFNGTW